MTVMHIHSLGVTPEKPSLKDHVFCYALSVAAVAVVVGAGYLVHHDMTRAFSGSILLVAVVAVCTWYLALMPAVVAGVLGVALLSLVIEPASDPPLAIALVIGIRCAVLIGVALAANATKQWLLGVETTTRRQEAYIAQVAAELTQGEQDRWKQYNELTLELRTRVGAILLAIEAIDRTSPMSDNLNTIRDACDRLSNVTQRLRDLGRHQDNARSTPGD